MATANKDYPKIASLNRSSGDQISGLNQDSARISRDSDRDYPPNYVINELIKTNYNRFGDRFIIDCECSNPCDGSPKGVLDLKLIESDEESDNEINDIIALIGEYSMLNLCQLAEKRQLVSNDEDESDRLVDLNPIDWITVRSSIGWSTEDRQVIKPFVAMALQQEKKLYAERSIAFLSSLRQRINTTDWL